jgi:hypothetical protein
LEFKTFAGTVIRRSQMEYDRFNHFPYLDRLTGLPFAEVFIESESGYRPLNCIGGSWRGGVTLVNTACGLIGTNGL